MYRAINITGGPGTGCSTLGRALAVHYGLQFFDGDDFYWLPTIPPFTEKRPSHQRSQMVFEAFDHAEVGFVLSGSVAGWDEQIENIFDAVIFLSAPTSIRLARIRARELERYGQINADFIEWAEQYDEGRLPGRSRPRHEAWLSSRSCKVIRQDNSGTLQETLENVIKNLERVP